MLIINWHMKILPSRSLHSCKDSYWIPSYLFKIVIDSKGKVHVCYEFIVEVADLITVQKLLQTATLKM